MSHHERFAEWLDVTMANKGIKGRELARRVGVHDSQISKWRSGQGAPTMARIGALARALDVDPYRLAATAGELDAEEFGVEPLPMPKPTDRRESVKRKLAAIPGLTRKERSALLHALDEMNGANSA